MFFRHNLCFSTTALEDLFLTLDTNYKTLGIAQQPTSDSKAFKIGCTFLKLMNYFHKKDNPNEKFDIGKIRSIIPRFQNKVSLPNNYDLKVIDFSNDDTVPERNELKVVRILFEERFLEFEDWLKNENNEIISWFSDSDLLIKITKDNSLNKEMNDAFQILSLEQYFDEQRKIEEEKESFLSEDDDEEMGDAVNGIIDDSYKTGEVKLPKDEEDDETPEKSLKRPNNFENNDEEKVEEIQNKRVKKVKEVGLFEENSDWVVQ